MFPGLDLPGAEVVLPPHIEPASGESLAEYAYRSCDAARLGPRDVVGGTSFGGMLAAEAASRRPVAGLIMLGSSFGPESLPAGYKTLERVSRCLPDPMFRVLAWRPAIRWRFAPIDDAAEEVLAAMEADCPPGRLRQFGRMIADWPGVARPPCPTLVIHGAHDRVIPAGRARADLVLDAGHVFTLTHAAQTRAALSRFVASL